MLGVYFWKALYGTRQSSSAWAREARAIVIVVAAQRAWIAARLLSRGVGDFFKAHVFIGEVFRLEDASAIFFDPIGVEGEFF